MAAITWTDVTGLVPDLVGLPGAAEALYLAIANSRFNVGMFPLGEEDPLLKLARIWLAAHYAAGDLAAGATIGEPGPVASESAGGLSVSYGKSIAESLDFGATLYGLNLRALIRSLGGARAIMVI